MAHRWVVLGLILIVLLVGSVATFLWVYAPEHDYPLILETSGHVSDKNVGVADNFKNGKVEVEIRVVGGGIADVLSSTFPLAIEIEGHEKQWTVPTINLRESSGKTEANYGETIECDGVVAGPDGSDDNLYVKISVPTTTGGNVALGMKINIEMWPTNDAVDLINGTIYPASFDNITTYDWWDNTDVVNVYIYGPEYRPLIGYDGAYLIGMEIDE